MLLFGRLLLHDNGGVKIVKLKFNKAKNVFMYNKRPFQTIEAVITTIERAPIKVIYPPC